MIQKKSLKDAIQNPEIISVVGELIGVANSTQNGLVSKNWCFPKGMAVTPEQEINNLEAGIYSVGAGNTNIPNSSSGVLFVDTDLTYDYKIQRFYDTKGNNKYRINTGSSWQDWK